MSLKSLELSCKLTGAKGSHGDYFVMIICSWDCLGGLGLSTIFGSDNGLSPGRRQAIIWTNPGLLLVRHLGTNISEILIGIQTFPFKKMHLKMSSAKWRPFCLGLNELIHGQCAATMTILSFPCWHLKWANARFTIVLCQIIGPWEIWQ